jgi:hypothetical protein
MEVDKMAQRTPEERYPALIKRTRRGQVSLILGAGLSIGQGVPSWPALVAGVRQRALDFGLKLKAAPWLENHQVQEPHPLAAQVVLEEIEESLRRHFLNAAQADDFWERARRQLEDWLQAALYAGISPGEPTGSLYHLARVLRADRLRQQPRIARVVTLNADDLLEHALNGHYRGGRYQPLAGPIAWPIARASGHPRRQNTGDNRPAISIYHVHGYLPRKRNRGRGPGNARMAPETLIFTDLQYWASVASPGSFANRVMAGALHDSYALFIGLSMKDVNLMRWLGVRADEIIRDKLGQGRRRGWSRKTVDGSLKYALRRHYWVRREAEDPGGFISRHLERRGIMPVVIEDWQEDFAQLLDACFPPAAY